MFKFCLNIWTKPFFIDWKCNRSWYKPLVHSIYENRFINAFFFSLLSDRLDANSAIMWLLHFSQSSIWPLPKFNRSHHEICIEKKPSNAWNHWRNWIRDFPLKSYPYVQGQYFYQMYASAHNIYFGERKKCIEWNRTIIGFHLLSIEGKISNQLSGRARNLWFQPHRYCVIAHRWNKWIHQQKKKIIVKNV